MVSLVIHNKFLIRGYIGHGAFGVVYQATNTLTNEEVAIKIECRPKYPQLLHESNLYRIMQGEEGIPELKWFGSEGDFQVLVIELLGPNLEVFLKLCSRRFRLKTVLMLADQLLTRIEYVHSLGIIHRDIKPENIAMGYGDKAHLVYLMDFGLAKKYLVSKTFEHIPYREGKKLAGTPRYASINSHQGIELSRRDDLESIGYLLIYLLAGSLPWQGVRDKQENYRGILEMKLSIPVQLLCQGAPCEFAQYLDYCKSLSFDQDPDYSYLRNLFRSLFRRQGFTYDYDFDWQNAKVKEDYFSKKKSSKRPRPHHRRHRVEPAVAMPTAEDLALGAISSIW